MNKSDHDSIVIRFYEKISEIAVRDKRIVLSHDRGLLMRRDISHGRYVRNIQPRKQLQEIVDWLDLTASIKPFTRCTRCNGLLHEVKKI
ncbi:MAG: Mut7-C RNAse domain-containing protein [Gammaproteobacteria bacterium]|nr:Mut7-C RNAse domain-containing protein [Gammaproteobacteria bacterium]